MQALPHAFYNRDTISVAQDLLGKYLVHKTNGQIKIGRIVEVEAYLGAHDLAAHSSKGITPRTKIMYGKPGFAYVYLIYGIYHCFNVVTEPEGHGAAVLIRALEPIENISTSTKGPGLLCRAMCIEKTLNGCDLESENFFITESATSCAFKIMKAKRIGVDYAGKWAAKKLRFYIKDNVFISRK